MPNNWYKLSQENTEWKKLYQRLPDGVLVFVVNGDYVRDNINIEFALGGHHYVYPDSIPENEIWVETVPDNDDLKFNTEHEIFERKEMKYKGRTYDDAHEDASRREKQMRERKTGAKSVKIKMSKDQWEKVGQKAGWMETYKSVRKPGVRPGQIIDDGKGYTRRIKNIGGEEDIPSIEELQHDADVMASTNGHTLGNWNIRNEGGKRVGINVCLVCGKDVLVKEMSDDITGKAIREPCI